MSTLKSDIILLLKDGPSLLMVHLADTRLNKEKIYFPSRIQTHRHNILFLVQVSSGKSVLHAISLGELQELLNIFFLLIKSKVY